MELLSEASATRIRSHICDLEKIIKKINKKAFAQKELSKIRKVLDEALAEAD